MARAVRRRNEGGHILPGQLLGFVAEHAAEELVGDQYAALGVDHHHRMPPVVNLSHTSAGRTNPPNPSIFPRTSAGAGHARRMPLRTHGLVSRHGHVAPGPIFRWEGQPASNERKLLAHEEAQVLI